MRTRSARLFLVTPLSVSLLVVAGCGQANSNESTEVDTQSTDPLLGETCPSAGAAVGDQVRVTALVNYVLGSPTWPFAAYPCRVGGAEGLAEVLRQAFALGLCTAEDPTQSTVCGLPAVERVLSCTGLSPLDGATVKVAASTIDACWGAGAGAFFQVSQSGILGNLLSVHTDPEPVDTTQDLSGSNGATAAAVYENSGTATNVIKWYSTGIYAPNLAAGTPCSTSDLPVGGTATKVILGSGSYKRCG